jgi:predicted DNA binding protein
MSVGPARVVNARFRIELPDDAWISEVSRQFPTADLRLLVGYRTEGGAMELGEVIADDPTPVSEAIESHPAVSTYQRLHADDERTLARYEADGSGFYEFVEQSPLTPAYPVVVRNGWFTVDVTATRDSFDAFRAGLEASPRGYELLSVVGAVDDEGVLTDRQREVLEQALQAGYFEVPRGCTLADVAASLDVDKSTASEVIRRAEGRLVARHLSASGV